MCIANIDNKKNTWLVIMAQWYACHRRRYRWWQRDEGIFRYS